MTIFDVDRIPGFHCPVIYASDHQTPAFVTLVLTDCRITKAGNLHELVFPDTTIHDRPLFFLDISYDSYVRLSNTDYHLPWRTVHRADFIDLHCLTHNFKLRHQPDIHIIYCTLSPNDSIHFRQTSPAEATHLIARSDWCVGYSDWNSLDFEQKAGHCHPVYLTNIRQAFGAILYRRVLSAISPCGTDYWVVPLTKSPA